MTAQEKLDALRRDLIECERMFKDNEVRYGYLRRSVLIAVGLNDLVETNSQIPAHITAAK